MTDNTLIERLEALTAPCRELDALIWIAIDIEGIALLAKYGSPEKAVSFKYGCGGFNDTQPIWTLATFRGTPYTASIDAAMTLVASPYWMIRNEHDGPVATIMDSAGAEFEGKSATPAIALCIAALKAREAS